MAIDYRFVIDAELQTIEAQACFRGRPPAQLVSGLAAAASALKGAWRTDGAGRRALAVAGGRIQLAGVPPAGCVGYAIDLDAAGDAHGLWLQRRGNAVATNVALWLWRPAVAVTQSSSTARVELPAGMRASLPWAHKGDRYELDASAFAFYAYAAFGKFELESIAVPGATLDVAVLDGLSPGTRSQVVPWLQHAARLAAQPFGHFPRPHAQLVVLPSGPARRGSDPSDPDDPVHFGTVTRGGGASALMLIASDATRDALLRDWVAVHEFSHLLHPFLRRDDAWLSEGIATYYQEVLRVRAGAEPEAVAWRRLYEGASLGRESTRTLAEESAAMMQTHAFKRIYWAGAAFALLTDAELRRIRAGRLTLDALLRDLAPRTATQFRPWRAADLLAQLDSLASTSLFTQAMRRWVDGPALPDLSELYTRLGIHIHGDHVEFDSTAPDAWLRAAIMAPSTTATPDAGLEPDPPGRDPLPMIERVLTLRDVRAFAQASIQTLISLAPLAREVRVPAGASVFQAGEVQAVFYVVARGLIELERTQPPGSARFGASALVGGVPALGDAERGYSARALRESVLLCFRESDFFDVMEDHFELARSVLAFIAAERVRVVDALEQQTAPIQAPDSVS